MEQDKDQSSAAVRALPSDLTEAERLDVLCQVETYMSVTDKHSQTHPEAEAEESCIYALVNMLIAKRFSDIGPAVRGEVVAEGDASSIQHDSDCSLHNMPAYPAGPCDCTAKRVKPDFATEEEWSLMGQQVEGSQNGVDWFAGELVEIIDLFAPYRVRSDGKEALFQLIRPAISLSPRAADALDSQPIDLDALRSKAAAFDEWIEKTEWVQEQSGTFPIGASIGFHRADVMRMEIERLRAASQPAASASHESTVAAQLYGNAMKAAQNWASVEHQNAKNLGAGGPGKEDDVDRAETAFRTALDAMFDSRAPAAQAARASLYSDAERKMLAYADSDAPVAAPLARQGRDEDGPFTLEQRMPPKDVEVLIYVKYSDGTHAWRTDEWTDLYEDPIGMGGPTICVGEGWLSYGDDNVTHWAPLPPAPQQEGSEAGNG